ncbi:hypothetical protein [Methanobrevibacter sp.]|uniref:hypothetical protein n=1 Tax=Methanobrevibacter sp. TaxID=66852 RepID=UPI0038696890
MAGAIITAPLTFPILLCSSLLVVGFVLYNYADDYEFKRAVGDVITTFAQDMLV